MRNERLIVACCRVVDFGGNPLCNLAILAVDAHAVVSKWNFYVLCYQCNLSLLPFNPFHPKGFPIDEENRLALE